MSVVAVAVTTAAVKKFLTNGDVIEVIRMFVRRLVPSQSSHNIAISVFFTQNGSLFGMSLSRVTRWRDAITCAIIRLGRDRSTALQASGYSRHNGFWQRLEITSISS